MHIYIHKVAQAYHIKIINVIILFGNLGSSLHFSIPQHTSEGRYPMRSPHRPGQQCPDTLELFGERASIYNIRTEGVIPPK